MPSEYDMAKVLDGLLSRARHNEARKELEEEWKENQDWLKGKQELGKAPHLADTVTNFIFSQRMSVLPILANRQAEVTLRGVNDAMQPQADAVGDVINRVFLRNDMVKKQLALAGNGYDFGKAFFKSYWHPGRMGGLGDIAIDAIDPRSIYVEDGKETVMGLNWIMEVRKVNKLTMLRMFPSQRSKVERVFRKDGTAQLPPEEVGVETGEVGRHATLDPAAVDTTTQAYIWDTSFDSQREHQFVDLVEAWFVDESVVQDTAKANAIDIKTGKRITKKMTVGHKAYPTGRFIVFSGTEIFRDQPNPFPGFPYVEYDNYYVPGEFWNMSDITVMKPLQEQFNIRMNQLVDNMNYTNHKIILYDESSGFPREEITNEPGGMYPVSDVNGVKVIDFRPVSEASVTMLTIYQRLIEVITGVKEVTQGQVPGDVRSGFAIEQLQEAAQTRLRLKTRLIEDAIRNLAKYMTHLIGSYYIPGVHYADDLNLRGVTPDLFEYEVKAGINLPQSRLAEQQMIQWAFGAGIVDAEYVIDTFDFKGKEALKQRMAQLQQQQALAPPQQQGGRPQLGVVQ